MFTFFETDAPSGRSPQPTPRKKRAGTRFGGPHPSLSTVNPWIPFLSGTPNSPRYVQFDTHLSHG